MENNSWVFKDDKFIRDLRNFIKRKSSYRHTAKYCGMSLGMLQQYIDKKQSIRMKHFIVLCSFMGVDPLRYFDQEWLQKEMF